MNLNTPRLRIRFFQDNDVMDLHAILGDEETMMYSEPPFTLAKTQTFLTEFCIQKQSALAVEHKESKDVIGYLLFHPIEDGVYEMGWFVRRSEWGKGYAYEACAKVIEYGFDVLKLDRITAETMDVTKSVPLMRKLGMRYVNTRDVPSLQEEGQTVSLHQYEIKREDHR